MLEVRQLRWAAWAVAVLLCVVVVGRFVVPLAAGGGGGGEVLAAPLEASGPGTGAGSGPGGAGERLYVHVAGAVRRPGLYRLRPGARVGDAVRRAGGPAGRAALDGVNLAAEVRDGQQVLVPRRGSSARPEAGADAGPSEGAGSAPAREPGPIGPSPAPGLGPTAEPGVAAAPGSSPQIDLNTATAAELDTLPGVGPATAQAILEYRTQRGRFRSVDELDAVPGIGPARLATLRPVVTV